MKIRSIIVDTNLSLPLIYSNFTGEQHQNCVVCILHQDLSLFSV